MMGIDFKFIFNMATIPSNAFEPNNSFKNLETAVKFYVAGCLSSPAIIAKPTNTPPIPATPVNLGVLATLTSFFNYSSRYLPDNRYLSKWSCLIAINERLATMLNNPLLAVASITNAGSVANLVPTGVNIQMEGVTNLEQLIFSLASGSPGVYIDKVRIGNVDYVKIWTDRIIPSALVGLNPISNDLPWRQIENGYLAALQRGDIGNGMNSNLSPAKLAFLQALPTFWANLPPESNPFDGGAFAFQGTADVYPIWNSAGNVAVFTPVEVSDQSLQISFTYYTSELQSIV
jgi:hypothetical protein